MKRFQLAASILIAIIALSLGVGLKVWRYNLCRAEGLSKTYCFWR